MVEHLDFAAFLTRYDRPFGLFYLDPPYWGREMLYGKDLFAPEDFERLAGILATLKASFLLSINDAPEIRSIFRGFTIEELPVTYRVLVKPVVELLISSRR